MFRNVKISYAVLAKSIGEAYDKIQLIYPLGDFVYAGENKILRGK